MPTTWLFDLDNTLHHADLYVFGEMNTQMNRYLVQHIGVDEATANTLRIDYWHRYGATLLGLLRHHPHIDPEHFLHHTHAFPDLEKRLAPMRGLKHILRQLPGRKLLFTNSPRAYARRVLTGLGVRQHFSGIIAIQDARYQPKPQRHGYAFALRRYGLLPAECIMVEDTLANLVPAHRQGMRTVWISAQSRRHPAVDLQIRQLLDLPRQLPALRRKDSSC